MLDTGTDDFRDASVVERKTSTRMPIRPATLAVRGSIVVLLDTIGGNFHCAAEYLIVRKLATAPIDLFVVLRL